MNEGGKRPHPGRLVFVILMLACWSMLIIARLIQLQVARHQEFKQRALRIQQVTRSIEAPRGVIYDRHMDELASSVTLGTVVAEPRRIDDVPAAAHALASILGLDPAELEGRMKDPARQNFMFVKHRIDPNVEDEIETLDINGIYLVEESSRVFPNRELASHVLGFVNMNGDGGDGIELQYDKELKGKPGEISFDVDARRHSFRGRVEIPPTQGNSLVLSLDRSIQYITERELRNSVTKYRATSGTAIVMESSTGRILALANEPSYNCNSYNKYSAETWRNRSVTDMFEPGSTFKVVVATAALEAGLTRPSELIDCQMGSIVIGGHVFHDHKPYGLLSFNQILENSSNVGAAKLGLRLGEEHLHAALRSFGFGSRTGIDLPGEISGLVRDWHDWSALSIGAISFGQEVGVTSMQIMTAINAIANGGYRVRPSIVDRIIDENGELVEIRTPERTRIMKDETAAMIREAFEGVVLRGTGRQAAVEGYRTAGKTGTAQKIVNGRYSDTKFVASFIGFAPLPQPKVTILVQIDEPKGVIYGGEVAAPAFSKICQEALLQLRIPPDKSLPSPKIPTTSAVESVADYKPDATPVRPLADYERDSSDPESSQEIAVRALTDSVVIPDFSGWSKRRVLDRCTELGIRMESSGSGLAVHQEPPPGSEIPIGETCSVTFGRRNPTSGAKTVALPEVDVPEQAATQHAQLRP